MRVELDAETFVFNGLAIDADQLMTAVQDDGAHFYRFVKRGESVEVEAYKLADIEGMIKR